MKLSDLINELMEQLKQGNCDVGFTDGCISDVAFVHRRKNFNGNGDMVLLSQEYSDDGFGPE